ncbi:MAG: YkgJ family cysteine cluster protein [bacterium]
MKKLIKKINNLSSVYFKFEKFFISKILGRKYIRTGKCKSCGRCCQEIYVRHSSHIIKNEEEFNRLKNQHFFYSYLKIIGKTETGLVFECTKLDKEKDVCTVYKHRALICRQYPQEEIFMMGGIISEECGYKFVPINSFEETLNAVQKKYSKKKGL